MPELDGRIALVTGAGQGIGEAIAQELYGSGATVYLLDVEVGKVDAVAARLGDRAVPITADVRDRSEIDAAVTAIHAQHARIDILVNNAARTVSRSIWDIDAAEWNDVLDVNLRGVLFLAQAVAPGMRDRGFGRIINLASLAGQQGGLIAGAHYAASKAGILVLTKILARELAPHGVTVNAVAPAAIDGPVMRDLPDQRIQELAGAIPVGRVGLPHEVAAIVSYLASVHAAFITGATIDINGGTFMR